MKALRIVEFNKNYKLCDDVQVPTPGPGQLLIKVSAAGFCHTDLMVQQGISQVQLPFTGSHEPAGTVVGLGPDIPDTWHVGDRVGVTNFMNPDMCGIIRLEGGFAEYMTAWHGAVVPVPDSISFEQAAPLMCAGATVWHAIQQAGLQKEQTIAIIGIGGLGVLGVQFAKALGYRVVAVDKHEVGLKLASEVPAHLKPDLIVGFDDQDTIQKISDFTDGVGLKAAVICTGDDAANDWAAHRLQPRGTCVVVGFPEQGFNFDPMNLIFREIVVKGSIHCSMGEVRDMMDVVVKHGVLSHLTLLSMDEAEDIPAKSVAHAFIGRPVVLIGE
ncbi:Polyketide synthase enoylreductase [Fusarium albosuccineum]|uniref:Polyketide synthase enoylreductase n=1 Tax=Fusarium albosuccineum TaxID=1237068 RepID=A0A8H4PBQ7_9HYPO|nr:Polyketide synthase enoylreductase [Fusarium albosuccineum]